MVVMSRDVIEAPAPQRLYQPSGPGRQRATMTTRYALTGNRFSGTVVDPLPLSLPPPSEDSYLLRSADDKRDVMVYMDDDAKIHGRLFSACPSPSVATNVRSTSFCVIPPTPPWNSKRPPKDRQTSIESAPPSMRVGASIDLLSPTTTTTTMDGHPEETTPPLTPDCPDGRLPTSSSYSRRGLYWAAVSDASETSDQPRSNWASFDLSFSDSPLRLPPSDTTCDLTVASVDSLTPAMSDSVAALSVEEFDPLNLSLIHI